MSRTAVIRLLAGASLGLSGAAFAADMPLKAPPPAVYNWTGFYGGVHAGYGGGVKDWGGINFLAQGAIAGVQVGVNQQIGNFVLGVEVDASWSGMKGRQFEEVTVPFSVSLFQATINSKIENLQTFALRLGLADDRWLIYTKAGLARAHELHEQHQFNSIVGVPNPQIVHLTGKENRVGSMIGIGAEYAFLGNWSAKVEYNYIDFFLEPRIVQWGTLTNFAGVTTTVSTTQNIFERFHIVKVGVNYRFGGGGAPAIAPAAPAPGYSWSGVYVGAQGAGGWAHADWIGFQPQNDYPIRGWLAGGTVGVNVQADVLVAGVEAELMGGRVTGGRRDNFVQVGGTSTQTLATRFDGLGMASLRVGFVAADRVLLYGKVGLALAHARQQETFDFIAAPGGTSSFFFNEGQVMHTGSMFGFGAEYAFLGNWSAKLEYNSIRLRQQQAFLPGTITEISPVLGTGTTSLPTSAFIKPDMQIVKFGLNYHFGAWSDVVKARF
jgi:opacity protein-like surface antigen